MHGQCSDINDWSQGQTCCWKPEHVQTNAESIGMKAYTTKTGMICISDALTFKTAALMQSIDGKKIVSTEELKVLGFRFGCLPTCAKQAEAIRRSFRGRYWLIIHMKQAGFTESKLLKAYKTIIRPIC